MIDHGSEMRPLGGLPREHFGRGLQGIGILNTGVSLVVLLFEDNLFASHGVETAFHGLTAGELLFEASDTVL